MNSEIVEYPAPSLGGGGRGTSALKVVTTTIDLQDTDPQPITGFPSLYAVVGAYAHSPSVDLSTVNPGLGGITMTVLAAADDSTVADFSGDNSVGSVDGVAHKGISASVAALYIFASDLYVAMGGTATDPATIQLTILVLDLS